MGDTMFRCTVAVSMVLMALPVSSAAGPSRAPIYHVYVRADGAPTASGTSPDKPVKTLEQARDIARRHPAPRLIHMVGSFELAHPLRLSLDDAGTAWVGEMGAKLVGNGRATSAIEASNLRDVEFKNFEISQFAESGLVIRSAERVTISGLVITNIRSTRWSQGGIYASGNVADMNIVNNKVDMTNYIGIGVFANYGQSLVRVHIHRNRVTKSCRSVADCGAIYLGGRGVNEGLSIVGNVIIDFGPYTSKGRGIYLDDWESNVSVKGNCIVGPGLFGIHIHGGHSNDISGNYIDARHLQASLLNQANSVQPLRGMEGNRFYSNTILVSHGSRIVEERQKSLQQVLKVGQNKIVNLVGGAAYKSRCSLG